MFHGIRLILSTSEGRALRRGVVEKIADDRWKRNGCITHV